MQGTLSIASCVELIERSAIFRRDVSFIRLHKDKEQRSEIDSNAILKLTGNFDYIYK